MGCLRFFNIFFKVVFLVCVEGEGGRGASLNNLFFKIKCFPQFIIYLLYR